MNAIAACTSCKQPLDIEGSDVCAACETEAGLARARAQGRREVEEKLEALARVARRFSSAVCGIDAKAGTLTLHGLTRDDMNELRLAVAAATKT